MGPVLHTGYRVYLITRAKVAELVDARDLGSRGFMPWGFESPLSHFSIPSGTPTR